MNNVNALYNTIELFEKNNRICHAVVGYDGFIDEIISVVDKRTDSKSYTKIKTIAEFSHRIANAAGKSANIEFVPQQFKIGGNGPILANALKNQNQSVSYIGALGENQINPIFEKLAEKCENVISVTDPGHTDALEFQDGKIMLGKIVSLKNIDWKTIHYHIKKKKIETQIFSADLHAITNWTMLPELDSIFKGYIEYYKNSLHQPKVFVDLADPAKRSKKDIKEMTELLSELGKYTKLILGLNESESFLISDALNICLSNRLERAKRIRAVLDLEAIIIHPKEGAVIASKDSFSEIQGPYTAKPKLSTGAGDNFNAGFCSGWLSDLDLKDCLYTGVCTSGFYVRNAKSPSKEELINFMKTWADSNFGEI